jgi:UDP-glucose 4-epimerase
MQKRYLITGGAGFIGSHLAERLLDLGHHVTLLDDFSTGRHDNVAHLLPRANCQLVRDTVENDSTVNTLVANHDAVFHLASAVGVQLIVDQPVQSIRTTIHGTEVVLQSAYRFNRPILITSSSEVYGKGAKVPFTEEDDVVMGPTDHARWCYAYAKGIDEFLGLAYHRQYKLPVFLVRLFNTVGPRQVGQYGMVLPRFVSAALANEPLRVFGTGDQTRCFCHVADVADALVRLMSTPTAAGQVFNLGAEEEVSMNALAQRVISLANSKSPITHIPYTEAYGRPFDDLPRRVPSLARIRAAIDFKPRFNLDQIIHSVITHQRATTP